MTIELMTEDDLAPPDADVNLMTKINELVSLVNGGGGSADVFNVVDYGAVGDGATDDSDAIRLAMADAAASGGTVYFPNGTYLVSLDASSGCLLFSSNTRFAGQSRNGSIIKLANAQPGSTRVLYLAGVTDVVIETLTIDGNAAGQTPEEHMAGVFLYASERVAIRDVTVYGCCGDGIDISASCYDLEISGCYIYENGRSGIEMNGGGQSRILISKCVCVDNVGEQIETEVPLASVPVSHLTIEHCYLRRKSDSITPALALAGMSEDDAKMGDSFIVRDNYIDGVVQLRWMRNCRFYSNTITTIQADANIPLLINGRVEDSDFFNNRIFASHISGSDINVVEISSRGAGDSPTRVTFRDNLCTSMPGVAVGYQLVVNGAQDVWILRNRIISTDAATTNTGISIRATLNMRGVVLDGNYICDYYYGVAAWAAGGGEEITDFTFTNNTVAIVDIAVLQAYFDLDFDTTGAIKQATIYGNQLHGYAAATEIFQRYPACPILIGGNERGRGIYSCEGSPEGVITDNTGALATDRATGITYVKRADGSSTGWVAVVATNDPVAARGVAVGPVAAKGSANVHAALQENSAQVFPGPFTNPDVPRNLRVTFDAGWDGGDVNVVGTNQFDEAVNETFVAGAGTTVVGVKIFKTVTSASHATTAGTTDTCSVGTGDKIGVLVRLADDVGMLAVGTTFEAVTFDATYSAFTPTTTPAATTYKAIVNVDLSTQ